MACGIVFTALITSASVSTIKKVFLAPARYAGRLSTVWFSSFVPSTLVSLEAGALMMNTTSLPSAHFGGDAFSAFASSAAVNALIGDALPTISAASLANAAVESATTTAPSATVLASLGTEIFIGCPHSTSNRLVTCKLRA